MEYAIGFLIIAALGIFVLFMVGRILEKAGFPPMLAILLLIPVANIALIWVFAFAKWPNLKTGVEQDLK